MGVVSDNLSDYTLADVNLDQKVSEYGHQFQQYSYARIDSCLAANQKALPMRFMDEDVSTGQTECDARGTSIGLMLLFNCQLAVCLSRKERNYMKRKPISL